MQSIFENVALGLFVFSFVILMASIYQFSLGNYDLGLIYLFSAFLSGLIAMTPFMLLDRPVH